MYRQLTSSLARITELAVLVADVAAHSTPSASQAAAQNETRLAGIKAQQEAYTQQEQEKAAEMQAKYGAQIQKKREEKAEKRRRAAEARLADGLLNGEEPEANEQLRANAEQGEAGAEASTSGAATASKSGKDVPYSIVTETATSMDAHPWYTPEPKTLTTLEAGSHVPPHISLIQEIRSALFPFPTLSKSVQMARFKVFEDLWLKGYYMGKGLKFGGDFLCYPGDPLRFHSHFTAIVVPSIREGIMPLDMVSWGRLATAVKKSCLLAAWNEEENRVRYLSLEWAGFG